MQISALVTAFDKGCPAAIAAGGGAAIVLAGSNDMIGAGVVAKCPCDPSIEGRSSMTMRNATPARAMWAGLAGALLLMTTGGVAMSQNQLLLTPNTPLHFALGDKQGTMRYVPQNGVCVLTVMLGQSSGQGGMSSSMFTSMTMTVVPGHDGRLATSDNDVMMFACAPGGQAMSLFPPPGFTVRNG